MIYLSYHPVDVQTAIRVAADLKNQGFPVWLDLFDEYSVADWSVSLQNSLNTCSIFIPLISPDYLASAYGRYELDLMATVRRPLLPLSTVHRHRFPLDVLS